MGAAQRRKLAGEYPQIDGRQPTKEKRTGMRYDPDCKTCHGSGKGDFVFIPHKGAPGEYIQKPCGCAEKMMGADVLDIIEHGTGLGIMKRAATLGAFEARRNLEGKP